MNHFYKTLQILQHSHLLRNSEKLDASLISLMELVCISLLCTFMFSEAETNEYFLSSTDFCFDEQSFSSRKYQT